MSDQTATISTSLFPAPAKPAPASAAARTKRQLEGPIFSTLLKLSAPNILNLLAFTGMVTFFAWPRITPASRGTVDYR